MSLEEGPPKYHEMGPIEAVRERDRLPIRPQSRILFEEQEAIDLTHTDED